MKKIILTFAAVSLLAPLSSLAADHVIKQLDKKFSTNTITVKAGDTISFQNDEKELTHNVYSLGPQNAFDIMIQKPNEASKVTFAAKGVTDVACAIHPTMKLKVKVE